MKRTDCGGLRPAWAVAWAVAAMLWSASLYAAGDLEAQATFKGSPVPGATVTASQGERRVVTTTDEDGMCHLALADGVWTLQIEMRGFTPLTRQVNVSETTAAVSLEMTFVAPDWVQAPGSPDIQVGGSAEPSTPQPEGRGLQESNEGLVVNGSVYNAAASPFAQAPAFGNNRPGNRSLFNGSVGLLGGNSAWDARPFSFSGQQTPSAGYTDIQFASTFGGPLKIPYVRARPLLNVSYQRSATTTANTVTSRVPTLLERIGDFSQSRDGQGAPVTIVDPSTGAPFPKETIPLFRLSAQALALLAYYPTPNAAGEVGSNYESTITDRTVRDALQIRLSASLTKRQQVSGGLSYQRANTTSTSLFQFADRSRVTDITANVAWSYQFSQTKSMHARYELAGGSTSTQPFFADRVDVSGEAGITGNDRSPVSWGPPNLSFTSGLAGLGTAPPASQRTRTHVVSADGGWMHGHHNVTFGGDLRPRRIDSTSQDDPRGTFTFTGAATGDDFADFLLGLPRASSISFGDGRTFLGTSANAFVVEDWGIAPGLSINAGLRWEYEGPLKEESGHMANLDLAPDFSAAAVVSPDVGVGPVTSRRYGSALIDPDRRGLQPRIGVSWRPLAASSLLVRGGYGVYRQTDIYLPIAAWLARQPPFATTASQEASTLRPLTLANGFVASPDVLSNTVAVDPTLRAGFAENWQASVQRDLPASLTVAATYLGTRGHHLLQESLPNTVAPGAVNACASCPAGFIYISSNGTSARQAVQLQLRRRLRSGFRASAQYTLAKATDNATAFSGASASGPAIAQDWRDLEAERGPSAFDQRHLLSADVEYTTGVGAAGGGLLTGTRGTLLKGWVFASQINVGSGLPVTPRYLTSVPGTGVTGTIRANIVDSPSPRPAGYFLDPTRYTAPTAGEWGTAGRNSARGPGQFALNASIGRSFSVGGRMTVDWRMDATNALNRVTYVSINALVGSPQFGLPDRANAMRKLRMTLRWRF